MRCTRPAHRRPSFIAGPSLLGAGILALVFLADPKTGRTRWVRLHDGSAPRCGTAGGGWSACHAASGRTPLAFRSA